MTYYYRPPCQFCNLNYSVYDRNKLPMICKKCTITCCYLCSDRGKSCPSCFEVWTMTENMLLINDLKENEPHHSSQKPVEFIDSDSFDKAVDAYVEHVHNKKLKKKKCIIM